MSFYAVRKGRTPGVYTSWDECKAQTSGVSGAEFRKFGNWEDAKRWVDGIGEPEETLVVNEDGAVAWVDGSFNSTTGVYGAGVIVFYRGKRYEEGDCGQNESLVGMRNVAGELLAAQKIMETCEEAGIPSLDLYYDYEGIEKWCTGAWQAKKEGTKAYKAVYDRVRKTVKIRFHKVTAHTGVTWNEEVDRIAKKACGLI